MAHTPSTDRAGTVVAVVGDSSTEALATLEGLPGVETLSLRDSDPALAARRIGAARRPWVIHDADPLAHVAAAWVELYEERSTLGALEVEVETALDQFQRGDAIMPDYYLVLDPDQAETTWRHWWCGALGHRAPRRVLPAHAPADPRDGVLRGLLTALPTSRPWPDPASWLPGLAFDVPDRVGLRDASRAPGR